METTDTHRNCTSDQFCDVIIDDKFRSSQTWKTSCKHKGYCQAIQKTNDPSSNYTECHEKTIKKIKKTKTLAKQGPEVRDVARIEKKV